MQHANGKAKAKAKGKCQRKSSAKSNTQAGKTRRARRPSTGAFPEGIELDATAVGALLKPRARRSDKAAGALVAVTPSADDGTELAAASPQPASKRRRKPKPMGPGDDEATAEVLGTGDVAAAADAVDEAEPEPDAVPHKASKPRRKPEPAAAVPSTGDAAESVPCTAEPGLSAPDAATTGRRKGTPRAHRGGIWCGGASVACC